MSLLRHIAGRLGPRGLAILHVGSWSLIAKVCAAANLFVATSVALKALDGAQFGAWATLVSIVAFSGFLDFGIGYGAMNLVASAHGRGAHAEMAAIIRESRHSLCAVAALAAIALVAVLALAPELVATGLPATASPSDRWAVAAVACAVVVSLPLNLSHRILLGLGRGDRAFLWQAAGQLGTLIGVVAVARPGVTLYALTAAAVLIPLIAPIANTVELSRSLPMRGVAPALPAARQSVRKRLRREGSLFFVLQLTTAIAFAADLMLISALQGPATAGVYAVVQRLFSVIPLSLGLAWAPLWPLYRRALTAGDHAWVGRTLWRSLILASLFAALASTAIILGFDPIMRYWAHDTVAASTGLVAGFAVWTVFEAAGTAIATFLNSASVLRFQLLVSSALALACFAAKFWVAMHYDIGLMPWVTTLVYCLVWILPVTLGWSGIYAGALTRKY